MAIPAMTKPAIDPINSLNIGLMIISCLAAYALPFELFLFSYAVLGPLHYMTQICWLHDRAYFTRDTRGRKWWLALVGAAMLVVELGVERVLYFGSIVLTLLLASADYRFYELWFLRRKSRFTIVPSGGNGM